MRGTGGARHCNFVYGRVFLQRSQKKRPGCIGLPTPDMSAAARGKNPTNVPVSITLVVAYKVSVSYGSYLSRRTTGECPAAKIETCRIPCLNFPSEGPLQPRRKGPLPSLSLSGFAGWEGGEVRGEG